MFIELQQLQFCFHATKNGRVLWLLCLIATEHAFQVCAAACERIKASNFIVLLEFKLLNLPLFVYRKNLCMETKGLNNGGDDEASAMKP